MTQKRMDAFWENKEELKGFPRFFENVKLIDLTFTPKPMQAAIIDEFNNYEVNGKQKLHDYFITKRMKQLYEHINDF